MATSKAEPKKDDPKQDEVTDQAQSGSAAAAPEVNVDSTSKAFEEALDKGYFGVSASTHANEEYSQETDPTQSPRHDRIQQADFDELREARRKETTTESGGN